MKRIYCDKDTNAVSQIFDLLAEPELSEQLNEDTFVYCYMVDTEEEIDYSYKYNKETEKFEKIEDYVEMETIVEPSKATIVEEKTKDLEMELYFTQSAVDFLLMSTASEFNINTINIKEKGDKTIMAGYLAMRIIKGMLSYKEVIARYPEFKDEIDFILRAEGKGDLIVA